MRNLLVERAFYNPPLVKGRFISVFPDDNFIVSYPKSGNTWLIFMIGALMNEGKSMDFKKVLKNIPDIYMSLNSTLKKRPRPRFLKSHEYLHPDYPKVLYLVRDPRSVSVSYFYYQKKMGKIKPDLQFEDFLNLFLDGKVDHYGPWDRHAGGWIGGMKNSDSFFVVKYEDLKSETNIWLEKIATFLNLKFDKNTIQKAIESSSMDSMRKAEKETLSAGDKSIPFVREGKSSSWESYFSEKSHDKLLDRFGPIMKEFGYK